MSDNLTTHRALTRFSDLDTQRHVNSRVYENLAMESRRLFLEERGYPLERMLKEKIEILPIHSEVSFLSQIGAGQTLRIETLTRALPGGALLWDSVIFDEGGKESCKIRMVGSLQKEGERIRIPMNPGEQSSGLSMEEIPPFTEGCRQVATPLRAGYRERDIAGGYPPAVYWGLMEEARWNFTHAVGMDHATLIKEDTITVWLKGNNEYGAPLEAGEELEVRTWIERFDKIRIYFRNEIRSLSTGEIKSASREEHLIVSLSRMRPRRPPDSLKEAFREYLEHPPE